MKRVGKSLSKQQEQHVECLCGWKRHSDLKELKGQCSWSRESTEPLVKILIFKNNGKPMICFKQWEFVHRKVEKWQPGPDLCLKRITWLQDLAYRRRARTKHHHSVVYRPHNLIPKWLNVCVYKCTYVLEFPGMGKAFFSAKSFQRALLPCTPHWCPRLQSVSSFA